MNYEKKIWKCTKAYKENTNRLQHIKVYRDEVKTSKRYTFFMSNFERFQTFLRFCFCGFVGEI